VYRQCAGQVEWEYEIEPDCRRIADTTTCRKPLEGTYGDWFVTCVALSRGLLG
jgi:hypothetical protein